MAITQATAYDEFVEFITSRPTLKEIATFRLFDGAEARISALLEANRAGTLTAADQAELDEYIRLEHLMRRLKIRAHKKHITGRFLGGETRCQP